LQTLLRNRLPLEVYDEEIIRPNREDIIRRLNGSGGNNNRNRNNNRSLLDSDNPEINQQPLHPTHYVPPPLASKKEVLTQKLSKWGNWLLRFVPEPVKKAINNAFDDASKKKS